MECILYIYHFFLDILMVELESALALKWCTHTHTHNHTAKTQEHTSALSMVSIPIYIHKILLVDSLKFLQVAFCRNLTYQVWF